MSKCENCGHEHGAGVCPNCGHSPGRRGFPWMDVIIFIIAGVPGLAMGGCGALFFVMEVMQGTDSGYTGIGTVIATISLLVGGGVFWLSLRGLLRALKGKR